MPDPRSKFACVDPRDPSAWAICDRCGFLFNQKDLVWQDSWAGQHLFNTGALVCTKNGCYDIPNEQLRTIILPPDPLPVLNARVPNYAYEEQTVRVTQYAGPSEPPWGAGPQTIRCLQDGTIARILEYSTSS